MDHCIFALPVLKRRDLRTIKQSFALHKQNFAVHISKTRFDMIGVGFQNVFQPYFSQIKESVKSGFSFQSCTVEEEEEILDIETRGFLTVVQNDELEECLVNVANKFLTKITTRDGFK